ncbi:hypothetical protein D3C72_1936100 [compost metagenome]
MASTSADAFNTLAAKIGQINLGKKYASGSVGNLAAGPIINVTGLAFTPSIVILKFTITPTAFTFFITRSGTVLYPGSDGVGAYIGVDSAYSGSKLQTAQGSISGTAFSFSELKDYARTAISWYAYE